MGRRAKSGSNIAKGILDFLVGSDTSRPNAQLNQSLIDVIMASDNPGQEMAKYILAKRAAGQANEITDKMMEIADDLYMFENTPIDMSQIARMERKDAFNRGDPQFYHGTGNAPELQYFDDIDTYNTEGHAGTVYLSDNTGIANSYVDADNPDSVIIPLVVRREQFEPRVDVEGSTFSNIDYDKTDQYGNLLGDVFPDGTVRKIGADKPTLTTDSIADGLRDTDAETITLFNILDRGTQTPDARPFGYPRNPINYEDKELGKDVAAWNRTQQAKSREPSTDVLVQKGNRLRSPFARFDPEFKHLKNLSASVVPASVGMAQLLQKPDVTKEEIEEYLSGAGL